MISTKLIPPPITRVQSEEVQCHIPSCMDRFLRSPQILLGRTHFEPEASVNPQVGCPELCQPSGEATKPSRWQGILGVAHATRS